MSNELSDHEVDVLLAMELNGDFEFQDRIVRAGGFTRGIGRGTILRLKEFGYIETAAHPCPGHEDDWRETGHYWVMLRKVKEIEPSPEWMARKLVKLAEQMRRCGILLKRVATASSIQHGEEMLGAAGMAKSWARELKRSEQHA